MTLSWNGNGIKGEHAGHKPKRRWSPRTCAENRATSDAPFPPFRERYLARALSVDITYYNRWRPHRALGQRAPCGAAMSLPQKGGRKIVAKPVLGGVAPHL